MAKISWVNHAGFIVEDGPVSLLSDPWLEGSAFNDGWSLLSPTVFDPSEFSRISHIWFSHEHPDHFSPPSLRKVPPAYRRDIRVLFQETRDKRVVKFCEQMGFAVEELRNLQRFELSPSFSVLCGSFQKRLLSPSIDSWLLIQCGDYTILNLNDYIVQGEQELKMIAKLAGRIDVLFTQFSFAKFVGNPDDDESHRRRAREKLDGIALQVSILRPKWVVPFASYVRFSHGENSYMNRNVNRVQTVFDFIRSCSCTPIVLYPGDVWEIGSPYDSTSALDNYAQDYRKVEQAKVFTDESVSIDELMDLSNGYVNRTLAKNSKLLVLALPKTRVYLPDFDRTVEFSYRNGLKKIFYAKDACDIHLSSNSLAYCFKVDWGADTLAVNGRFCVPPQGNQARFFGAFAPARYNNAGIALTLPVSVAAIARKLQSRFQSRFGKKRRIAIA